MYRQNTAGVPGLLEIEDCLDANGEIALPPDATLISLIERNVANVGDAVAYRYLDHSRGTDVHPVEVTWTRFGARLRAIGARVQQVADRGERVAVLAPQGIDYVAGFYAAVKAGTIAVPLFAVSTITDHVAPWRSVYKVQMLTDADVTFVLSNGGHNAGIVNPPGHPHRHHQIATHREHEIYVDPDAWQQAAERHEGTWWPCWLGWLDRHSGEPAPRIGAAARGYPPLADAPGEYVRER